MAHRPNVRRVESILANAVVAGFDSLREDDQIARVRAVSGDACRLYLELPSGGTATVTASEPLPFDVGSVVLIRSDENHIEAAPDEIWPENSWVGVVRLRLDDVSVIDQSGRLRIVSNSSAIDFSERNTVEVSDLSGVIRVLSPAPIRFLDIPSIDDAVIATFRTDTAHNQALTYDDFGGDPGVLARARELVELPLQRQAELTAIGARGIKGVLFSGPPGTGKTLLARIIASQAQVPFYTVSGPEIFSKWYGESEELLRKLFDDAAGHGRAIIFFDEIDSVAGRRSDETHEVSRRVVAQLLTLMDGFSPDKAVIVIAATNRPQDIDDALRRPGRFDWNVEFSLPEFAERVRILKATARPLMYQGHLSHEIIARQTVGWSGAELALIWSEAALLAAADERAVIVDEDYFGGFDRVADQRRSVERQRLSAQRGEQAN